MYKFNIFSFLLKFSSYLTERMGNSYNYMLKYDNSWALENIPTLFINLGILTQNRKSNQLLSYIC